MSKKLRAAGYLRRSDKKQEASIKDQRAAIVEYAACHGIEIVRWYTDDGISGDATEDRPAFLQMREDVSSGAFDIVLCWDKARFGRFDGLDAGYWIYPYRRAGVGLVTVMDGPVNWDDLAGRLSYMVEQEGKNQFLRDHSANVLRGQIEAAKQGSWIGTVPYGYRLEGPKKNKRLVLGEAVPVRVVQRIFHEYTEDGRSMTNIAKRLNADGVPGPRSREWEADAIKWILRNVAYVGTYRSNVSSRSKYHTYTGGRVTKGGRKGIKDKADWIVIPNNHPAIVDQRTFDKAQAILDKAKTRRTPYTRDDNPYLLSGLVRCGRCGLGMAGTNNGKYRYYECSRRNRAKGCAGTTVREDEVLDSLVTYVENRIIGPDEMTDHLWAEAKLGRLLPTDVPEAFMRLKEILLGKETPHHDARHVAKQLAGLEKRLANARRNLAYVGDIQSLGAMQAEIAAMEEERAALVYESHNQPTAADVNNVVLDVLRKLYRLANLEPTQLRPVLRELDHITVYTRKEGDGTATRHVFQRGEVFFSATRPVGALSGKLNPHRTD